MFKIDLEGLERAKGDLEELKRLLIEEVKKELYLMGQHLRSESVKEVPVDTGRLRASATVAPVKEEGGKFTVEVGYGTNYAIYVHEKTENRHRVGKAKYLEDPLKRNAIYYRGWFENVVRRILK